MDEAGVFATHYHVDRSNPALQDIGGLRGYAAVGRRDPSVPLLAVQTKPGLPPRARMLTGTAAEPAPHLVMPLDHGPGRDPAGQDGWFILCPALPGPALTASTAPWTEAQVLNGLLMPAAAALDALAERNLTHRAIRPANVFRTDRPGEKIVLGPCWATPPASLQPSAFEPPYSGICLPTGRGEGGIADDVYALAATMVWCLQGGPGAWPEEAAMVRTKLEIGSYAALAGRLKLSSSLGDLLRVMLAEDPDHRPAPALLRDPGQAGSRRLAARPPQRAPRAIDVGGVAAWSGRELAYAIARQPEQGVTLLKSGAVDRWLRRILGDSQLAVLVDDVVVRRGADAAPDDARTLPLLAMRAVAVLDPLAPIVWRGLALFPDGLGPALVGAQGAQAAALEELVAHDVVTQWSICQPRRHDIPAMERDLRDWRGLLNSRGAAGGLKRLTYSLNPLLPCASPLLGTRVVARLADLLPALEDMAVAPGTDRKRPPLDAHIIAFIAARSDSTMLGDVTSSEHIGTNTERSAALALFARLQARLGGIRLPGLAGWLMESGLIDLKGYMELRTRAALSARVAEHTEAGQIAPILTLLQDHAARDRDQQGVAAAAARVEAIEAELAGLRGGAARRAQESRRTGQDIAAGAGTIGLIAASIAVALAG